jgi:outer membrane protein assembly factor BamB
VRIERWTFRFLRALALVALGVAATRPLRASHFALPGDTFTDARPLDALKVAIDQRAYADAAAQLDTLLNEEGDKLMATESPPGNRDGGLISVAAWVDTLAPAQRSALATAYREKFDASIRARVDVLAHDANARSEEFYSLARRHRFSATGAAAYALAADRVLKKGDLCAASALYQLALRGGWVPDDARAARIELLRRHVEEGKALAPPPDISPPPAADGEPSSIPGARASRLASAATFTAPLPFDAPWIVDGAATAGQTRFFPFAADGRIYQSGPRSVLAFKETGQVLWSAPSTSGQGLPPTPRPLTDHVDGGMQPATYAIAALTDVYGRAQVLVVRQPVPPAGERDNDYCLRALRASDGKLLWSTELQPLLKDVSFASTPAVCGRFTYAIALATHASDAGGAANGGDRQITMLLIALDTLSGELRWQATLGHFTLRVQERDAWTSQHEQPWDIAWHQSEPLVVGDAVYVTPSAGFAAAVGRFDGKLLWLRPYPQAPGMDSPRPTRSREELRRAAAEERSAPDPALAERWRGTPVLCGNVLIAAPQDTAQVFGFDAATGRLIWANGQIDIPPTLIGRTATTALFAGPSAVAAIEARDGGPSWHWEPPSGTRITGPAVVKESEVLVPTSHSIIVLRSEDGAVVKEPAAAVPNLRRLLNGDALKRAVEELGAAHAFGLQPSP